jgi:hypothetical protein
MKTILYSIPLLFLLSSCNLTNDVEIDLPVYETQPVVECYLEPGKPFRLLLTKSYPFFSDLNLDSNFIENTLYDGAEVKISFNGETEVLENILSFDPSPLKIFNYTGTRVVPATPGIQYTLEITLPDGSQINGQTVMMTPVPIDSIKVEWSETNDTLARMLTYITDDRGTENYYRRLLNYASLDSFPEQDFLVTDRFSTTELFAFGTGYELLEGDTVFNTICHIEKPYYDYVESVQLAVAGNGNPFAQPSPIKSNVQGTANPLGIFTSLVYDRDTTIIQR